jgi:hypothetical protein
VATLVRRDGSELPWWSIDYGSGGAQVFGEMEGVERVEVPAAMTVHVPPAEPIAVRVDFPDSRASTLFMVVAESDAPVDGEDDDGEEFTGVRDPRTDAELWVWVSRTEGRGADAFSVLSGEVPTDLEEVLLVGGRNIVVPVAEARFYDVGWDGAA